MSGKLQLSFKPETSSWGNSLEEEKASTISHRTEDSKGYEEPDTGFGDQVTLN
jgi:hypothetical protein